MSQPPEHALARFAHVAEDLREAFAHDGHLIDRALEQHPAFSNDGLSRSALVRALARDALARSAAEWGLHFQTVNGSGREFRVLGNFTDWHFRLRRATRSADGELVVKASNESAVIAVDETVDEQLSMIVDEPWVFGYVLDADGQIAEVFLAEVLRIAPGRPGRFVFGKVIALDDGSHHRGGGFLPVDEGLDGFGDEDEGWGATGSSAS